MDKLFVTKSSMPPIDEYMEEIRDLWDTKFLTNMGAKHKLLQEQLVDKFDCPYVELFSSGHMALELTIKAFDLSGEVITTPYTFASTTHAIVRNGLTPVFCDIDRDNYTIDTTKIEQLITDKTSAILPVHVYGNICNVEEIERIAKKYNLIVIYDAAHVFAETYKNKSITSFGDASVYSFHATKVFHTVEGGASCVKDERIQKKLAKLRNFGIENENVVSEIGTNAKMSEYHAAMGLCNLRHLSEEIKKRELAYHWYHKYLDDVPNIRIHSVSQDTVSNYAYFPILILKGENEEVRDRIYEGLKSYDIYARKYFHPLTCDLQCYNFKKSMVNIATDVSKHVLTLPIYSGITEEQIKYICDHLIELLSF